MLLSYPLPRGGLGGGKYISPVFDHSAPLDERIHFPAGDKSSEPGAGRASQIQAAEGRPWQPFRPMQQDYNWRHGVCGDLKNNPEHLSGGKYFFGGKITAEFDEGQEIDLQANVVFHHGGFFVFHICDVSLCPGNELSEECFKAPGACEVLKRVTVDECESGESDRCSPIDRNYPERWYLPCSQKHVSGEIDRYGTDGTMRYHLPPFFSCEHCVLHLHHESADRCNPDGYAEYYSGPDAPRGAAFTHCPLEGETVDGEKGLFYKFLELCGATTQNKSYSEDYAHCADVRIKSLMMDDYPDPHPSPFASLPPLPTPLYSEKPSPTPAYEFPYSTASPSPSTSYLDPYGLDPRGFRPEKKMTIQYVDLIVNGKFQEKLPKLNHGQVVSRSYVYVKPGSKISFLVLTSGRVDVVRFYVNDEKKDTVFSKPFFLGASPHKHMLQIDDYMYRTLHLKVLATNLETGEIVRKIYRLDVRPQHESSH